MPMFLFFGVSPHGGKPNYSSVRARALSGESEAQLTVSAPVRSGRPFHQLGVPQNRGTPTRQWCSLGFPFNPTSKKVLMKNTPLKGYPRRKGNGRMGHGCHCKITLACNEGKSTECDSWLFTVHVRSKSKIMMRRSPLGSWLLGCK